MDQSKVGQFRDLEARLHKEHPDAQVEAEKLASSVASPKDAGAEELWHRTWDKPLFANTKVPIAEKAYRRLLPYMDGAWAHWGEPNSVQIEHVGKGVAVAAFTHASPLAQEIREQTGVAPHRLYAIQGAAKALRVRSKSSDTPYRDLADQDIAQVLPIMKDELGFGWGHITILHLLTDLGLACKPDLHLVRTIRHLGIALNVSDRRVASLADALVINRAVKELTEDVFGEITPNRLRYMDKTLMDFSHRKLF